MYALVWIRQSPSTIIKSQDYHWLEHNRSLRGQFSVYFPPLPLSQGSLCAPPQAPLHLSTLTPLYPFTSIPTPPYPNVWIDFI